MLLMMGADSDTSTSKTVAQSSRIGLSVVGIAMFLRGRNIVRSNILG